MVYHHLARFGGHRFYSSGDMFLVCHMIKQYHLTKGPCDYKDGGPSR